MSGNIRIRFRIEYKGDRDDVETPHPITVDLTKGSSIIDLLNSATHFHAEFAFTSRYIHGVGDVVGSLCSIINDEEPGFRWIFYSPAAHCIDTVPSHARLTTGEEVVARYEKLENNREDQHAQLGLLKKK